MLDQLKSAGADGMGVEQLVSLITYARGLDTTAAEFGVDMEWLAPKLKSLERELKTRMQDEYARRLNQAKSALAAMKTPDEKRAELADRIAKLEAKMG